MKKSLKPVFGLCFILVSLNGVSRADERTKALVANLRPPNLYISISDLALKLPSLSWKDSNYSIQIKRQYKGATEAKMLANAESVYPAASTILAAIKAKGDAFGKLDKPSKKSEDFWWYGEFDGTRLPYAITAGAVNYYYNQIQRFRRGDFSGSNKIKMSRASLKYNSSIQHHKQFETAGKTFRDVYVVQMHLEWEQYCGNLCAMSINRKRTVILPSNGEMMAIGDGVESVIVS